MPNSFLTRGYLGRNSSGRLRQQYCPECGGKDFQLDSEKGEQICKRCGTIVEDSLPDFSGGRHTYDEETGEKKGHWGSSLTPLRPDLGLGTTLGRRSDFTSFSPQNKAKLIRLEKWNSRPATSLDRNLQQALHELKRVSSFLKLPLSVEREAASIYRQAAQKNLVRGRSIEAVVAGTLYAACRRMGIPRTLEEIGEAAGIEKKEIGRTYRYISRELEVHIKPSQSADYLPRFATALNLSPKTHSKALELLKKASEVELTSGRGPTSLAAAALYVATLLHGEKRTQREVADVAGVTEVTIRNRYKELLKELRLTKFAGTRVSRHRPN